LALSRKRKKELKKLRAAALDLWEGQKDLLDHANRVAWSASHNAAGIAREDVAPRVRYAIDHKVKPGIASATAAGRDKVNDVLPSLASTIASAIAVLEVAKDPRVRAAFGRIGATGTELGTKVGLVQPKKSSGAGKYVLIGLGLVAAAGVAYAAWQTLRADDELWVSDDDSDKPAGPVAVPPAASAAS